MNLGWRFAHSPEFHRGWAGMEKGKIKEGVLHFLLGERQI